jgi:anti-anti-sigma factor
MTADVVPLHTPVPAFEVVGASHDHGITWVWLRGDLDLESVPAARAELDALLAAPREPEWLLVYLGEGCFVDLHGLRTLDDVARRLTRRGGRLVVVAPPSCVRTMIELTGVGAAIPLAASTRSASAWVRRHRDTPAAEDGR